MKGIRWPETIPRIIKGNYQLDVRSNRISPPFFVGRGGIIRNTKTKQQTNNFGEEEEEFGWEKTPSTPPHPPPQKMNGYLL